MVREDTSNFVKQRSIIAFYILAFVLTWLGWVPQTPYARGLFPFNHPLLSLLGGAGPMLAAVIILWAVKGRDGRVNCLLHCSSGEFHGHDSCLSSPSGLLSLP